MLNLKEFEASFKSVTVEEMLEKKQRGKYLPFFQIIVKKAKALPPGKSAEFDMKDPKIALSFCGSLRHFIDKLKLGDTLVAGSAKNFIYCGKRNGTSK